jgi:hypothetical protein
MRALVLVPLLLASSAYGHDNDYPTVERVDQVLTCMRTHGGQTVDNLYACGCEVDIIAQQLSFDDFTEARTFEIYRRMPGEKGSLFRDNERGKKIVARLERVRGEANKRCFIGRLRQHPEDVATTPTKPDAVSPAGMASPVPAAP